MIYSLCLLPFPKSDIKETPGLCVEIFEKGIKRGQMNEHTTAFSKRDSEMQE